MCATSAGTPEWLSTQARILGPSESRKIRLSAVSTRKKTSDESSPTTTARPLSSAPALSLTPLLASDFAASALLGSRPRSLSQPAIVSLALSRWPVMLLLSPVIPVMITTVAAIARAISPTSTRTAASSRGTRWVSSQRTSGEATAATTEATITGPTIT